MRLVRFRLEQGRRIGRFGSVDGEEHGEEHVTRTVEGFTGVVVEGDGIDVLAPP